MDTNKNFLAGLLDKIVECRPYHHFLLRLEMNGDVIGVALQVQYFIEKYFSEYIAILYKHKIFCVPGTNLFGLCIGKVACKIAECNLNGSKQFFFSKRLNNIGMR